MRKIKALLEKHPQIYKVVRRVYIPLAMKYGSFKIYLRRNNLGDLWAQREHDWLEEDWNSSDHPHRSFLVERIAAFSPVSSVLEIGCGAGPNLYLLAKRFPDAEIRGIDISPMAVKMGNKKFSKQRALNIKLSVKRAEELDEFQDKSFDIVFTDATLIYVSHGNINKVINKMIRIARKGLVLVERHDFEQRLNNMQGIFTGGLWVRDYVALLKQFIPEKQIHVTRITKNIWPDSGWVKNGAIIEVAITDIFPSCH